MTAPTIDEGYLPREEVEYFYALHKTACLSFINGNRECLILNGCIHEADRLLKLVHEDETLDKEVRSQYETLIDDKFYQAYGDCLFIFALGPKNEPKECEMALELSTYMYHNVAASTLLELRTKRIEIVRTLLTNQTNEQVAKEVAEFFESFCVEELPFFFISWLAFRHFTTVDNAILFNAVSKSVQSNCSYGPLSNRIIAQVYLQSISTASSDCEELYETALDFIEIETEEALENNDINLLLNADAIQALILFEFSKICDAKKMAIVTEKLGELMQEIDQNDEYLECPLPAIFLDKKQDISTLVSQ